MSKLDKCYHILGIGPGATPEDVEEAYGELAKVWGPERFPKDDHIRGMAKKKMAEIDAARNALLGHLRSGENTWPGERMDRGTSLLNRACDNPRCTGVLDREGTCDKCGKRSAPNSFRYMVFCPACGTRNVIASQRDYDRGTCADCGMPFGAPVRLEQKSSRKTAYLILLVVIVALALFFFSSEKPQNSAPKKIPLNAQSSQPSNGIPTEKAINAQVTPRAEPEVRVQSTPAPLRSTPPTGGLVEPGHSTENTGEVPEEPSVPETASGEKKVPVEDARGVLFEENRGPQPVEQAGMNTTTEGKDSKPVEQAGRISAEPRQEAKPVGEVRPSGPDERGKENYDRLIDEVVKKKAAKPKGKTGELRDLPFGKVSR